jgi:hypothetical protein
MVFCPLYPPKADIAERVGMSALCQKQTSALRLSRPRQQGINCWTSKECLKSKIRPRRCRRSHGQAEKRIEEIFVSLRSWSTANRAILQSAPVSQKPLWVKSRHCRISAAMSALPPKSGHRANTLEMSVKCQKQTFRCYLFFSYSYPTPHGIGE